MGDEWVNKEKLLNEVKEKISFINEKWVSEWFAGLEGPAAQA